MAKKKKEPMADIIQYDNGENMLIWKHHIEDFNFGSQLIVHDGQEAVFFRNGKALDTFGPGRHSLVTNQIPGLEKLYKLPAETEAVLQSEVYFVNTTVQMGLKWGTDSKVRIFDEKTQLHLELGASGEFNIRVTAPRKLLVKIIGAGTQLSRESILGMESGRGLFRGMVMTQVKNYLAKTIRDQHINILEIDTHLLELSAALRDLINAELADYGLEMTEFYISRIVLPEEDPRFRELRTLLADSYLKVLAQNVLAKEAKAGTEHKRIEAEAHAKKAEIDAKAEAQVMAIKAEAEAEILKARAKAEAEAIKTRAAAEAVALATRSEAEVRDMRNKKYSYQQETIRKVSMEAMKNGLVGQCGCDSSNLGELASLSVGLGAVGSIAGMTKDVIGPAFSFDEDDEEDAKAHAPWICSFCHKKNPHSFGFCPGCGRSRAEAEAGKAKAKNTPEPETGK